MKIDALEVFWSVLFPHSVFRVTPSVSRLVSVFAKPGGLDARVPLM